MNTPPVVSPQEWDAAREEMLVKEKAHTRARDALAAERRRMPWMAVEKEYEFEGPDGKASLLDLFDGRRQLVVYRFFFDPGMDELPRARLRRLLVHGGPGVAPRAPQRARHDARVRVARAAGGDPAPEVRDGLGDALVHDHRRASTRTSAWASGTAPMPSSATATSIFRTYFVDSRGDEAMGTTWSYLDITALGRQEEWEDSPEGYPQTPPYEWWNYHDAYGEEAA